MKNWTFLITILLVIALFPKSSLAEFKPNSGAIKGYMVNEYFYYADHHDEDLEGRHGLWFRRIYFTYDNKLNDKVKMISGLICSKDINESKEAKQNIPIIDIQKEFEKFLEIFKID